ncbi:MAG: Cys-tRNA(Pro) deacylase [Firmicutes bacterium]|nr:Cys-tRNA(Pro) deacylase [Bacillota bacterium]
MAAELKTNAMRILEREKISYTIHEYESRDGLIDGISAAHKMGIPEERVYKTIVTKGCGRDYYVFVVPVAKEIDLKAAARAVGEKSVALIPTTDLFRVTGYIRGGCSPVGMKKKFVTILDESCRALETMVVSAGKIGHQVELAPADLQRASGAEFAAVSTEPAR